MNAFIAAIWWEWEFYRLEFRAGENRETLATDGKESYEITGVTSLSPKTRTLSVGKIG